MQAQRQAPEVAPEQQQESDSPSQAQAPEQQAQGNAAASEAAAQQPAPESPTPVLDQAAEQETAPQEGAGSEVDDGGHASAQPGDGGGATDAPAGDDGGGGGGGSGGGGGGSGQPAAVAPEPVVATGTKEYAKSFADAPPTVKATEYKNMGAKLSELGTQETQAVNDSLPEMHARLDGEDDEAQAGNVDPAQVEENPEDGATGQIEEVEQQQTQDLGAFEGNDDASDDVDGLSSKAEKSAKESATKSSINSVSTTDGALQTSPGPTPNVPTTGDTDLARTGTQRQSSGAEASSATEQADKAVTDLPGRERVQPMVMDEVNNIQPVQLPTVDQTQELPEQKRFMELQTLPEVGPITDLDPQIMGEMQQSAVQAQQQIEQAADAKDTETQAQIEKGTAEAEQQRALAQQGQEAVVTEQRAEIDSKKADARTQQKEQLQQFHSKAEAEQRKKTAEGQRQVDKANEKVGREYDKAERQADSEKRKGDEKARRERAKKKKEAENQSWWDRAVSAISDLVSAIADAVNAIFDAVRSAVSAILDAVKSLATAIIDAACKAICALIEAYGEFLKFAIQNLVGAIFPGIADALCAAVDAAVDYAKSKVQQLADGLKAGIAAICDAVNAAVNAIISAYQAAVNTALGALQALITGDWTQMLLKVLEAVLKVCGINPDEFYGVIGKAEETINIIVDNPGKFLSNCIDAVSGGFSQFAENFLGHLKTGFMEWLTGQAGDTGITMPDEFNLEGIFSIVLQVMGLTKDKIREKAVEHLGEENVARIEFVWGFIEAAIEGGLEGLWEHLQGHLDSLWDDVIGAIQNWIMQTIVIKAVTKLATMFNPVGAIVQAVLTAWDIYCFLRDEIQRIFGVVKAVIDTVNEIATGQTKGAANMVEQALADLVPVAISLLANLLGLGGIGKKVAEVIGKIQKKVWGAIDKVILKIKGMFKGDGKGEGDQDGGKVPEGEDVELESTPVAFEADAKGDGEEEDHSLYIDVSKDDPVPILASKKMPLKVAIKDENEWKLGNDRPAAQALADEISVLIDKFNKNDKAWDKKKTNLTGQKRKDGQADQNSKQGTLRSDINKAKLKLTPILEKATTKGKWPGPRVGRHSQMLAMNNNPENLGPDQLPKESHHVPAKRLCETFAEKLEATSKDIEAKHDKVPWTRKVRRDLRDNAERIRAHGKKPGDRLSAVLIHPATHRQLIEGKPAVHGDAAALAIKLIDDELKERHEDYQGFFEHNKLQGQEVTLPQYGGEAWDAFLMKVAKHVVQEYYDVPDKPVSQLVGELKTKFSGNDTEAGVHIADKVGEVIATYQTEGFETAMISEKAKVRAALGASKVDGTPAKQKEFDQIDGVAAACWEPARYIEV